MKERPILFSTEMVKAILEGRKTMTRRIIKPQPDDDGLHDHTRFPMSLDSTLQGWNGSTEEGESRQFNCRYGYPSDVLWVRESFAHYQTDTGFEIPGTYRFKTDRDITDDVKFKPSIHLPKAAARIWLEVTKLKVERLHDISNEDAIAEGVNHGDQPSKTIGGIKTTMVLDAKSEYFSLWSTINGEESLTENPWVWVVEFKVLSTTGKP